MLTRWATSAVSPGRDISARMTSSKDDESAEPFPRRPSFGRSAGDRLASGRGALGGGTPLSIECVPSANRAIAGAAERTISRLFPLPSGMSALRKCPSRASKWERFYRPPVKLTMPCHDPVSKDGAVRATSRAIFRPLGRTVWRTWSSAYFSILRYSVLLAMRRARATWVRLPWYVRIAVTMASRSTASSPSRRWVPEPHGSASPRRSWRRPPPPRAWGRQFRERRLEFWSPRENHGALDEVFELAHIAGPVIVRQGGHRLGGIVSIRLCMRRAYLCTKCRTRRGMSSRRSRSGGITMGKTFSR